MPTKRNNFNLTTEVQPLGRGRRAMVRTAEEIATENAQGREDVSVSTPSHPTASTPLETNTSTGMDVSALVSKPKKSYNLAQEDIDAVKDMKTWAERHYRLRRPTDDAIVSLAINNLLAAYRVNHEAALPENVFQLRKKT